MAKEFKVINNFFRVKDTISGFNHIIEDTTNIKYYRDDDVFSFFPITVLTNGTGLRDMARIGQEGTEFDFADIVDESGSPFASSDALEAWLSVELGIVSGCCSPYETYTVELIDALTVDFYADSDKQIHSITEVLNSTTITLEDDGVTYVMGDTIDMGSKITVTTDSACVINLNIIAV